MKLGFVRTSQYFCLRTYGFRVFRPVLRDEIAIIRMEKLILCNNTDYQYDNCKIDGSEEPNEDGWNI